MNLQQLNELDFSEVGCWPRSAKVLLLLVLCLLLAGGLYYLLVADSLGQLSKAEAQERELRAQLEGKARLAASLPAYRAQMNELARRVDTQLRQLPNTSEVAGLLDDISFIAANSGLALHRINWEPEVEHEFSTELPMRIEVAGSYHQLGQFTAALAALPRIVILENFTLAVGKESEQLTMNMLAKTYRYNGQDAKKKRPEKKP